MNRNLVMGGVMAAALHAGVLFGFPRGAVPAQPEKRDLVKLVTFPVPPPEEPEDVVQVAREDRDGGRPESPLPRGADLPDPRPADFQIESKLTPEIIAPGIAAIPVGELGWTQPQGNLFDSRHLDNPPRTRVQGRPFYPREAQAAKLDGEVLVEFTVDEAGRVLEPRVVRSSDRVFEDATLRAVAKWRFEPGRRHGQIVRFRMAVPVVFGLSE